MANDRGLLRTEHIAAFKTFLGEKGIAWAQGKGLYQLMAVLLDEGYQVITTTGKGVISTPPELAGLIQQFHTAQGSTGDVDDTQRLDFLLTTGCQVWTSLTEEGEQHYVESSFPECIRYPRGATKREAIDNAITVVQGLRQGGRRTELLL